MVFIIGNETLATLTLGGFDAAIAEPKRRSFQSVSNHEIIGITTMLESVTYSDLNGTQQQLSSSAFDIVIDATVPDFWLPEDVCGNFERAFGITYDQTSDHYTVNDTLHNDLQFRNPNVSFNLAASGSTEEANASITLPYASFDLELGPPIVNSTQRYFPLRKATNESQAILGRAFLQEW